MKQPLWGILISIKIGLTEKMRKMDMEISQNGLPSHRETPWGDWSERPRDLFGIFGFPESQNVKKYVSGFFFRDFSNVQNELLYKNPLNSITHMGIHSVFRTLVS